MASPTFLSSGTLSDRIGSSRMYTITNLKIIGKINGSDFIMIRDMAGGNFGRLSVLDLSEAKIVEGGYPYSTRNDVIGDYAFVDCDRLTSLSHEGRRPGYCDRLC